MAWVFVKQTKFYLHDHETLLEGLIRQGLEPNYQCGEGYCGTCKINHQPLNANSQLHYTNPPVFMLNEGEMLPCCCYVVGVLKLDEPWYNFNAQLTDEMSETINLTIRVDGKIIQIYQTYPIRKVLHYTFWDILMSV